MDYYYNYTTKFYSNINVINEHINIYNQNGLVLWGWFSSKDTNTSIDRLHKEMNELKGFNLYVNNKNEGLTRLHCISLLKMTELNDKDIDLIPKYYRNKLDCKAYFLVDKIEQLNFNFIDNIITENGKKPYNLSPCPIRIKIKNDTANYLIYKYEHPIKTGKKLFIGVTTLIDNIQLDPNSIFYKFLKLNDLNFNDLQKEIMCTGIKSLDEATAIQKLYINKYNCYYPNGFNEV